MVRASGIINGQDGVKTPHRIELCESKTERPKRVCRKRRIDPVASPKTENVKIKCEPTTVKKNGTRSKPLKINNGCSISPGINSRGRTARGLTRGADSHKLTEYFNDIKTSPPSSPITVKTEYFEKIEVEVPCAPVINIKVEAKVANGVNRKLTEYFPVRRSVRKTSKCVMAEKMRDLEKAVREQREDGLEVCVFSGKGRGVIATQPFARGQFVVEYSGELVGVSEARAREQLYAEDPSAGCYMYYFKHNDQQYCIDATAESGRLGRLVNHSRTGNLVTKALWVDGPRLVLVAAQDIAPGEELTYDYGDRSRESLRHHPWLAL